MNLYQLRDACQLRTSFNDPAFNSTWNSFINEAVREFARLSPWDGLEDVTTVTSDGTKYLILPPYVDSLVSVMNLTDSLPVERSADWDRTSPAIFAQGTTGRVINYDKIGIVPALRDPSGYAWFQSSHASDTQTLYFTGVVNNSGASGSGLQSTLQTLSVAAAGTSPVTLSTLFSRFTSISKTTDSNGTFYFYDAGASNAHLSYLGPSDGESSFKRLHLLYVPAAQTLFQLRFRYKIPTLTADAQAPHPSVKPDFVIHHAISLFWGQQNQLSKAAAVSQKAGKILQDEINRDHNYDEPYSNISPLLYNDYDDPGYVD
jgi:hypothetical protein